MPTYQYVCTSCEAPLEVVQSFSDPSLTECPACDGGKLRKVFSAVGVVFKGSGFYRTDNRAGGKSGATAAEKGGDSSAAPAKTDSAPAAKGESKAANTSSSSSTTSSSSSSTTSTPSPSSAPAKPAAKSA